MVEIPCEKPVTSAIFNTNASTVYFGFFEVPKIRSLIVKKAKEVYSIPVESEINDFDL